MKINFLKEYLTSKHKKNIFFVLRLLFLVLSISWLYTIVDFGVVIIHLRSVPLHILLVVFLLNIIRIWLTGFRWRLLNPDELMQLSSWYYFRFSMIALTFNLLLPGALGGDFVKTSYAIQTVDYNKGKNVIAVLVDRFVGLISVVFIGFIALTLNQTLSIELKLQIVMILLSFFFIIFLAVWFLYGIRKKTVFYISKSDKLSRAYWKLHSLLFASLQFYKTSKKQVLLALLICLPIQLLLFSSFYIFSLLLGLGLTIFDISAVMAIVMLITSVPLTLSGLGIRELSLIYLLSFYGVEAELATTFSIYIYILSLMLGLLGTFFIIDWKKGFYSIIIRLKGGKHENM